MKYGLSIAVFISLVGVALAARNDSLDEWVQGHLVDGEDLVCEREVNNDYFFVAKREGRIKSGYRIDVTSSSGTPKTFIISWRFQDEKGNYIGLRTEPEVIAKGYVRSGGRMYAEEVAYRDVSLKNVESLNVSIALKKYGAASDAPSANQIRDDELDRVVQCKAPLH
jgi:hypothetical protein